MVKSQARFRPRLTRIVLTRTLLTNRICKTDLLSSGIHLCRISRECAKNWPKTETKITLRTNQDIFWAGGRRVTQAPRFRSKCLRRKKELLWLTSVTRLKDRHRPNQTSKWFFTLAIAASNSSSDLLALRGSMCFSRSWQISLRLRIGRLSLEMCNLTMKTQWCT